MRSTVRNGKIIDLVTPSREAFSERVPMKTNPSPSLVQAIRKQVSHVLATDL